MKVTLHHHVPGRTRLRLAGWPDEAALGNAVRLLAHSGLNVSTNAYSRSVLIRSETRHDAADVIRRFASAIEGGAGATPPTDPRAAPAGMEPRGLLEPYAFLAAEDVLRRLGTTMRGLSADDAASRLETVGPNRGPAPAGRSPEAIIREQLATFPVAMLIGSAVLSVATGGVLDALVTVGVVALNAAIGYSSGNATERLIQRLSKPVEHDAVVIRGGMRRTVPASEVVPGDILVLAPSSIVPADARVIEATQLSVDESTLTGESLPVHKIADALDPPIKGIAMRRNLLHAGTIITGGDGLAVTLQTGGNTEMARMREMIALARPPRPEVEIQLEALAGKLVVVCLGASGLLLAVGTARGEPLLAMVKGAIALAVAAIPEGLPAVATTTLALAAREMERKQVYVRALPAIEALSGIDIICLDKTGTLTENHMAVRAVAIGDRLLERSSEHGWTGCADQGVRQLANAATLCNEASLANGVGSGTERALLHLAEELGLDPDGIQRANPIKAQQNRNDLRRWMSTRHETKTVIKGAPDEVINFVSDELVEGLARPIDKHRRREILATNEALAARGLRVLGVAETDGQGDHRNPDGFIWLGLVALADPVRPEAREALDSFHRAGIRTIMITGDQAATALAVAEELALSRTGVIPVVESHTLNLLDEKALGELAGRTSVFARVGPADKLRIVEALQAAGKRVAMIGDGVNDGPALRAASVGVAMGKKGTDVAREVADIVIADDDLRALWRAIARSRGTGDNIRNAIRYFLSTNLSEMVVMLGESLHGAGEMETPMELFWLNLVTDILPGLGLALAEPRGDVMAQPPRPAEAPLFDGKEIEDICIDGISISAATLAAHFLAMARGGIGAETRTATFLTLALSQIVHGWTLRDHSAGSAETRRISERRLEAALASSTALLALPVIVPTLRRFLGISTPGAGALLSALLLSGASFGFTEGRRIIARTSARAEPSPKSPPDRTRLLPAPAPGHAQPATDQPRLTP